MATILVGGLGAVCPVGADQVTELHAVLAKLRKTWADESRPQKPSVGELLFLAPDQYQASETSNHSPPSRATTRRTEYAEGLFQLAQQAAKLGQLSLAFQLATEAVSENGDHAEARRVLGYESHQGEWRTPFARRMVDGGKVWHPQFGWIRTDEVDRYEKGERPKRRGWISAQADAKRRERLEDGWRIRTDHFLVTTNHSLQAGTRLAARLERLHQVWRQLFAGFYLPDREVRQLFAGTRSARGKSKPMRVFYHRNQEEYIRALRRRQPRIDETLGIYFDTHREAHFFAGDDRGLATLYHEAVHQLFQESGPTARHVGGVANFWIVEGIATYFESLTEHEDPTIGRYYTLGEAHAGRLPAARRRLLEDQFYLPLVELTRFGKLDLQRRADLAKIYSQSAGVTTFLMQADSGQTREPLVRYLAAIYAGQDGADSLAELTGQSFQQLDREYREFLESLP